MKPTRFLRKNAASLVFSALIAILVATALWPVADCSVEFKGGITFTACENLNYGYVLWWGVKTSVPAPAWLQVVAIVSSFLTGSFIVVWAYILINRHFNQALMALSLLALLAGLVLVATVLQERYVLETGVILLAIFFALFSIAIQVILILRKMK